MANSKKKTAGKPDFYVWLLENWSVAGGLINQTAASKVLKRTTGRLAQMIREGKLTEYRYENQVYVSYAEVMKIARDQAYKTVEKGIEAEIKEMIKSGAPEDKIAAFRDAMLESFKMAPPIVK